MVALLLLASQEGWLWVVFVAAAVQSAVAAFSAPAESALVPSLVADRDLVAANALNALNNRLGRLVGLPVGGALLGVLGLRAVVLVDCASFAVAAALIAPVVAPRRAPRTAPAGRDHAAGEALSAWVAFGREWLEGLRLVRRERTVAVMFAVLRSRSRCPCSAA